MKEASSDYDGAWKEALEGYFAEFMAFFFPLSAGAHRDRLAAGIGFPGQGAAAGGRRMVKLLDYRGRWSALESSPNPFATVVMAHLKTQETRRDEAGRQAWKLSLTGRLYEQGYDRRLAQADQETLERWAERPLEAATIEEVFREEL